MKRMLLVAAVSMLAFSSCKKENEKDKVFKGPVQQFQHGKAWTLYEVNNAGNPLKLSIVIDNEAMNSLDPGTAGGVGHHHTQKNAISLQFHPAAQGTPFTHALLDWNPHGHDPEPIYGKPHFDFHFYVTSEAERLAIPLYEQATAKFLHFPALAYLPVNYVPIAGGVPQMGTHWVDVTSPELSGAFFTETFIYGTYDGKVNFYEPMMTEAFIKQNASFERSIPQPAKVQKSGWFPTMMRMKKADGVTNISIENFVHREAS